MKAKRIIFRRPYEAELENFELEESIKKQELLVKTLYSLISAGTELAVFTGLEQEVSIPWLTGPRYPTGIGYCNVGEVLVVGKDVRNYQVGDIVFSKESHSSHIKASTEACCLKVPKGLEPCKATFARMAAVSITAVRAANLSIGDKVLIIGMGLVGNLAAQLFLLAGADVMGADIFEFRLQQAKKCGVNRTVNPGKLDIKEVVMDWTKGKGTQITVESVGQSELILRAVELTGKHGEVILLGSPRKAITINVTPAFFQVHIRGITIKSAWEGLYSLRPLHDNDFTRHSIISNLHQIFGWLEQEVLKTDPLLTHLLPPEKYQEAYNGLDQHKDKYLGVVFDWRGPEFSTSCLKNVGLG